MGDVNKSTARRILAFKVEFFELLAKHDLDLFLDYEETLVGDRRLGQEGYTERLETMPDLLQVKRRRP
jgi:hypothetical protein